jgi:uncharacterized FAD-dependent dehydrogenase
MLRLTELRLPIDHSEADLRTAILERLGIPDADLLAIHLFRRGYDARKATALIMVYTLDVAVRDEARLWQRLEGQRNITIAPDMSYRLVTEAPADLQTRPVVVGMGPCGFMAGLLLAQMGFRPLILERGTKVRQRTKDTWDLWRRNQLHPESNVQFGEGGAGTFSDGKLHSQIKDPRYLGRKVLNEFVKAGAPEEILYLSKPHVGTFRLVSMVEHIRAEIEALGGEIRFEQKVADLLIDKDSDEGNGSAPGEFGQTGQLRGIVLENGEVIPARHVILALGHSARDSFEMLHRRGVYLEAKPFSIGVRIEHPQKLIDQARLGRYAGHPLLGAADYKLVHHASNGRAVYSFCMCPGGQVVAATSEPGRVVTNGMSQYSRAERNANAGMVVSISPADFPEPGPLGGIALQRALESRAYEVGGGNYEAPAQLVGDFLAGKPSHKLGSVTPSYQPGVKLVDLADVLPEFAVTAMREAIVAFEQKIKGYSLPDAVLTGVETRTSSPVRITRGDNYQSLNIRGIYPAGEGAGYAGGILSAAVDGIKVAEAVALTICNKPLIAGGRQNAAANEIYG